MMPAEGSPHVATFSMQPPEDILRRALEQGEYRVIEYVLDEVLAALEAESVVLSQKELGRRRTVLGRQGGRVALLRPERHLRDRALRAVLDEGQIYQETTTRGQYLGFPVRRGESVMAALFLEIGICGRHSTGNGEFDHACLGSLVAVALLLDSLQVENRRLDESLQVLQRQASRPPLELALLEGSALQRDPPEKLTRLFPGIVGESAAIRRVLGVVPDLALSDIPILIEGESGTGKELVARAIHRLSHRESGPFVTENCGAIPEHLVEAELFGAEKGAFTGASLTKPGLLERAHGGTLFLDEVGEMDLHLQKKLLRVLQEREVRRVGAHSPRPVNFRLVSATNRVLEDLVADGAFREDLFYRLHAASLSMPALRERREDIPLLVQEFNRRYSEELAKEPLRFSDESLAYLCAYYWPGNVRELKNEIWRLVTASRDGTVTANRLSRRLLRNQPPTDLRSSLGRPLEEVEREVLGKLIRDTLRKTEGNVTQASRLLRITRATLYRRMMKYNIRWKSLHHGY